MKKLFSSALSVLLSLFLTNLSFSEDVKSTGNNSADMPEVLLEYVDRLQQAKGVNADIDSYQDHYRDHLVKKRSALKRYEAYSSDLERYYAFLGTSDSAFTDKAKLLEEKRTSLKTEKDEIVKIFDDLFAESSTLAEERKVIFTKLSILYDVEKEIDVKVKDLVQKNKTLVESLDGNKIASQTPSDSTVVAPQEPAKVSVGSKGSDSKAVSGSGN
jgi:hypothetical protein